MEAHQLKPSKTVRQDSDFYATPQYAINLIIREIDYQKIELALEPASGDGRIIHALHRFPWDIEGCDIVYGVDYLTRPSDNNYDLIITNPPFSLAQEFITKALTESRNVIMLLRLNFLGAQSRCDWWQDKSPQRLFVLSQRPCFVHVCKGRKPQKGCGATYQADTAPRDCEKCGSPVRAATDSIEYAWFCWGPDFIRPPGVYVL